MANLSRGDTVGGRYRIRRQVDSGGFADVYEATDTGIAAGGTNPDGGVNRMVAVKIPKRDSRHDTSLVRESFVREMTLLREFQASIQPAGLVRLFDARTESSGARTGAGVEAFLATEFLDGPPLSEAVAGRLTPGSDGALRVGVRLCQTLAVLHVNGWCHRDLKPQNVLFRSEDGAVPVLIDFGTATPADDATPLNMEQDGYKPPELDRESELSEAAHKPADVYACGALLSYLATGIQPITDDGPGPDGVSTPTESTSWPSEVTNAIRAATRPSPGDRPSATELLGRLLGATGMPGMPAGLAARLPPSVPETTSVVDRSATAIHHPVGPGTTVGSRETTDGLADVLIPDPDGHVSAVHFEVRRTDGEWTVHDRSLNGTYLRNPDDDRWRWILCEEGRRRLQAGGHSVPPRESVADRQIVPKTRIAPVDPEYGVDLVFNQ
jgi:protein kinase/serine/threonine-protein kinase